MSIDTALSGIGQIISMEQQLCSPAGVASASSATAGASASGAIRFQVSLSAVLHAGGYLSQPADTRTLPSQPGMVSGPGQHVTIYDRAQPGSNGHVIMEIDGQFYESGGMAGSCAGGGGVEKIGQPSDSYLATFDTFLHPDGL